MSNARGAHLVGGLAAPDATTAMTTTARILGRHLVRLTDGETGPRSQWIWWQIDKLTAIDGIAVGPPQVNPKTGNPDYSVFPGLEVDEGIVIPERALGYADAAIDSYAEFVRSHGRRHTGRHPFPGQRTDPLRRSRRLVLGRVAASAVATVQGRSLRRDRGDPGCHPRP
jgi:hypothetical protein